MRFKIGNQFGIVTLSDIEPARIRLSPYPFRLSPTLRGSSFAARRVIFRIMLKLAIIVCLLVFAACDHNRAPKRSTYEAEGSSSERVSRVSAILTKHSPPPTAILDAHFVEEQSGDGVLGPSDFRAFYFIQVTPQDVAQWTKILTPLAVAPEFDGPAQPRAWWISRDTYASLQFYKPDPLTGRIHGWIGVSQQTGRIYAFTFTM